MGSTSRKYPEPAIWKCGRVEYHFRTSDGRVFLIYTEDADGLNPRVIAQLQE